jgi:hypothetical protein
LETPPLSSLSVDDSQPNYFPLINHQSIKSGEADDMAAVISNQNNDLLPPRRE